MTLLNSIPQKILFLSLVLAMSFSSCKKDNDDDTGSATFAVLKADNSAVTDNQTISFSTVDANANLHLKIKNQSATDILMRVKLMSITNADGSNMQVCVGLSCFNSVTTGGLYPNSAFSIAAGQTQDNITFWNQNTGTGTFPIEYKFKFFEVDASGNQIGDALTFTYQYNP